MTHVRPATLLCRECAAPLTLTTSSEDGPPATLATCGECGAGWMVERVVPGARVDDTAYRALLRAFGRWPRW